jgi:hypothetical protein
MFVALVLQMVNGPGLVITGVGLTVTSTVTGFPEQVPITGVMM